MYEGSDLVPSWRINSTIYFNTQLPKDFEVNEIDYSLTVQNVPAEWNFTALQCVVGTQFSNRGYLFVIPNSTTCFDCVPSSSTSSPTDQSTTLIEYTSATHTGVFTLQIRVSSVSVLSLCMIMKCLIT